MFDRFTKWSHKRNIIAGSNTSAQFLKLSEEFGEIAGALNKGRRDELAKEIGDVLVCLNNLALSESMTLQECCDAVWDKIKDRKGIMHNGIYVKYDDIPDTWVTPKYTSEVRSTTMDELMVYPGDLLIFNGECYITQNNDYIRAAKHENWTLVTIKEYLDASVA